MVLVPAQGWGTDTEFAAFDLSQRGFPQTWLKPISTGCLAGILQVSSPEEVWGQSGWLCSSCKSRVKVVISSTVKYFIGSCLGLLPMGFSYTFFISVRNWRPFGLAQAKQVEAGSNRM